MSDPLDRLSVMVEACDSPLSVAREYAQRRTAEIAPAALREAIALARAAREYAAGVYENASWPPDPTLLVDAVESFEAAISAGLPDSETKEE